MLESASISGTIDLILKRISAVLVACLGVSGCGTPDRSPADVVKQFEDDISHGNLGQARTRLTAQKAGDANGLFVDIRAEEHNRREEGIVSEKRSTEGTGATARVVAVYVMKDGIRRTYTWELLREQGHWRIDSWQVEVASGPSGLTP